MLLKQFAGQPNLNSNTPCLRGRSGNCMLQTVDRVWMSSSRVLHTATMYSCRPNWVNHVNVWYYMRQYGDARYFLHVHASSAAFCFGLQILSIPVYYRCNGCLGISCEIISLVPIRKLYRVIKWKFLPRSKWDPQMEGWRRSVGVAFFRHAQFFRRGLRLTL